MLSQHIQIGGEQSEFRYVRAYEKETTEKKRSIV